MDGTAVFIDTDVYLDIALINLSQAFGAAAEAMILVLVTILLGGLKCYLLPELPEQFLITLCKI